MQCIVVGAVRRTKPGHGDSDDTSSVQAQFVESPCRNQQSQRGIQSAGNADYDSLTMYMRQALGQSCDLDGKDFFTSFVKLFSEGTNG